MSATSLAIVLYVCSREQIAIQLFPAKAFIAGAAMTQFSQKKFKLTTLEFRVGDKKCVVSYTRSCWTFALRISSNTKVVFYQTDLHSN